MNKRIRTAALLLAVLTLALLLSPLAPAGAAETAEGWELEMIRADFSARVGILGGGVRVAVIDSGISPLSCFSSLAPGRDYTGLGATEDEMGHGTFVAGILGAAKGEGFRGVAPEAELVPLRCFTDKSGELEPVIAAIYDAVDEFHCRVISLSFGQREDSAQLREAVAYALSQNVVVVAAAGNSGSGDLYYPASYEGVIAVSAVDRGGILAADAQHNPAIGLCAPGVKVTGPAPEGGYIQRSGSSFAVPFVSGAAALLLSADGDLTPAEIREILFRTAADRGEPGWDRQYGWGILDVEAALRMAMGAEPFWLSPPKAVPGGVEVVACNPGEKAQEGVCRLGEQKLPLALEPGETALVRFEPQPAPASCAVWCHDASGGEACISNVREWAGGAPVFSDVPEDAWFFEEVSAAALSGWMLGLPDGRFDPGGEVTRGMFVTTLYRAAGSPATAAAAPFADVPADAWFAPAAAWAAESGFVNGVSEDLFAPEQPLTREAMAVILARMEAGAGRAESGKRASDYADAGRISPWALAAMDYCVSAGIVRGVSETELDPQGTLTRAALAVLLARLYE